jgi:hemerythrin-like domain-containing protein
LEEHSAINGVLDYLGQAVDALEQGRAVDSGFFRDIEEFFTLFVGRCHHGKEEQLLFPAVQGTPEMVRETEHLEAEHAQGTALADAYCEAVEGYAGRGLDAAAPLIAASRAYSAMLREHIARENAVLLPWAERTLEAAAQHDLVRAFDRYEAEVMGAGTHERLHRMIDTLGPKAAGGHP